MVEPMRPRRALDQDVHTGVEEVGVRCAIHHEGRQHLGCVGQHKIAGGLQAFHAEVVRGQFVRDPRVMFRSGDNQHGLLRGHPFAEKFRDDATERGRCVVELDRVEMARSAGKHGQAYQRWRG
jgi:hypothetical protein